MTRYFIVDIAGILALLFWFWTRDHIPEGYNFWYWFIGVVLLVIVGSLLTLTKRLAGWGLLEFILFIWITALGIVSFCVGILRLKVM